MYATHFSLVDARASIWNRFDPLYMVKRRSPLKMPIDRPGNVTSTLAPSVFTVHAVVLKLDAARFTSS